MSLMAKYGGLILILVLVVGLGVGFAIGYFQGLNSVSTSSTLLVDATDYPSGAFTTRLLTTWFARSTPHLVTITSSRGAVWLPMRLLRRTNRSISSLRLTTA